MIREFADVERMATLMPGAAIEGRDEEGNYLGGMTVAFGPKRIKFKGKVTVETDIAGKSGKMRGRGAADMRAARIETRLAYTLHADESASEPTTIVQLKAEADLQGVLAEFAKTGGEAVGNVMMEEFSWNMAAEFGRKKSAAPAACASANAAPMCRANCDGCCRARAAGRIVGQQSALARHQAEIRAVVRWRSSREERNHI